MTINQDEYGSSVGLRDVYIAAVTEDSAGNYTAGTPEYLAPSVTLTEEIAENTKTDYADDGPFSVDNSEGESKLTLEVTNIPASVQAAINGMVFDVTTKQVWDNAGVAPYFAIGFRSQKSSGKYLYFWYLKGRFSKAKTDRGTKTDTPDAKHSKIVFTAVKSVHQFDLSHDAVTLADGVKRVFLDEDITGADATGWLDDVVTPPEVSAS